MAQPYTIRTFTSADIPQVVELQEAYNREYPGTPLIPGELYLSPAFHEGQDVFCAFSGERLVAYAPLLAQIVEDGAAQLPHCVWTEVKALPDLAAPEGIKDELLDCVKQRARELVAPFAGRETRLIFDYRDNEAPAIAYALARGFQYRETIFHMQRDLNEPIPQFTAPQGISICRWKMESEAEQREYVEACNECFPETPTALAAWQYFLQSPEWSVGVTIAAFAGSELVGALNAYWTPQEGQPQDLRTGYTEDIFVRPAWRGKGIARAAITEGLRYLKEHGLQEAHLAVRALNENALGLYQGLGYRTVKESRFYARTL
jgi:ribosomal protein S18 acetylase RimI-like enzyme